MPYLPLAVASAVAVLKILGQNPVALSPGADRVRLSDACQHVCDSVVRGSDHASRRAPKRPFPPHQKKLVELMNEGHSAPVSTLYQG